MAEGRWARLIGAGLAAAAIGLACDSSPKQLNPQETPTQTVTATLAITINPFLRGTGFERATITAFHTQQAQKTATALGTPEPTKLPTRTSPATATPTATRTPFSIRQIPTIQPPASEVPQAPQ